MASCQEDRKPIEWNKLQLTEDQENLEKVGQAQVAQKEL